MAQLNSPTGAWLPQGPRTAKVRTREGIEEMDDDVGETGVGTKEREKKKRDQKQMKENAGKGKLCLDKGDCVK